MTQCCPHRPPGISVATSERPRLRASPADRAPHPRVSRGPGASPARLPRTGPLTRALRPPQASGESVEAVALSVVQACSAAGLAPTREMFNHLLVAIAAKGPPSAVLDWFGRARSAGIGVGTIACNLVIAAHVAQGDVKTAAELLTLMMRGEAARGGIPPPNAVTFNTVISAFARACDPQKAELTLVAMIDSGLVPAGPASYASVIAAWARAAQPATAERWLSRMLSSCVPLAGTAASEVVAFNATLDAFAKASDVSGARRVLDLFRARADSTPGLPMRRGADSCLSRGGLSLRPLPQALRPTPSRTTASSQRARGRAGRRRRRPRFESSSGRACSPTQSPSRR